MMMILAHFERDAEIGAKESAAELGDEFLARTTFVTIALAPPGRGRGAFDVWTNVVPRARDSPRSSRTSDQ